MKVKYWLVALMVFGSMPSVQAAPVTYGFEVSATTGPLDGITSAGTFTFDDNLIPAGGGNVYLAGLLIDLNFTWNGIAYDETTANTGGLTFDASGDLLQAFFGTACSDGLGFVHPRAHAPDVRAKRRLAGAQWGGGQSQRLGRAVGAPLGLAAHDLAAGGTLRIGSIKANERLAELVALEESGYASSAMARIAILANLHHA